VIRQARQQTDVSADYAAEMVRQTLFEKYGESIYSSGYKAITTLRRAQQAAADLAVWRGIADYDQRHGYRGPEKEVSLPLTRPIAKRPSPTRWKISRQSATCCLPSS